MRTLKKYSKKAKYVQRLRITNEISLIIVNEHDDEEVHIYFMTNDDDAFIEPTDVLYGLAWAKVENDIDYVSDASDEITEAVDCINVGFDNMDELIPFLAAHVTLTERHYTDYPHVLCDATYIVANTEEWEHLLNWLAQVHDTGGDFEWLINIEVDVPFPFLLELRKDADDEMNVCLKHLDTNELEKIVKQVRRLLS